MNRDTDGDGLTDGEEAGHRAAQSTASGLVAFSDPTSRDSDADGLDDAAEADLSLDAFTSDTDGDGLSDGSEVESLGTAPDLADTDSDGFGDSYEIAHREDQGLDPLWPDVKVDSSTYAWEFAQGAVLGELAPGESLAWLAGNLVSGGASLVPGIGWVAGGVADLRDAVGASIHQDWVGAGFGIIGMVPAVGDAAAVPAKIAKFVLHHPELAGAAGAAVVALKWLPDNVKASAVRATAPGAYDELRKSGISVKSIIQLQQGRVGLAALADGIRRSGNVGGVKAPFFKSGAGGERFLAKQYAGSVTQRPFSTQTCVDVCNAMNRRFDVMADGVAHESKVGRVYLSPSIRKQIESDAYCIKVRTCEGAVWHFFPSAVSNLSLIHI